MKDQQRKEQTKGPSSLSLELIKNKSSCKGEVISSVVNIFCSIADTITAIYEDSLPKGFAQQIITVFTTVSVDQFNNLFTKLCNDLIALELQAFIDSSMVQSSGLKLKNNIQTVDYVLKYAQRVYNDFV